MLAGAWSLYISFQNYNIQEGTGKVIYKPSIFDEEQLHLKQDCSRSHKSSIQPRTVTMLQHVLLLHETKGSCVHVLLITACVSDYVHMLKLCHLQTEETHTKLLVKSTARDS